MKVFFILLTALATVCFPQRQAPRKKQTLRNSVEVSAVEKEDRIEDAAEDRTSKRLADLFSSAGRRRFADGR